MGGTFSIKLFPNERTRSALMFFISSEILTILLRLRSSTSKRGSLYNCDFDESLHLDIGAGMTYSLGEVLEAIIA